MHNVRGATTTATGPSRSILKSGSPVGKNQDNKMNIIPLASTMGCAQNKDNFTLRTNHNAYACFEPSHLFQLWTLKWRLMFTVHGSFENVAFYLIWNQLHCDIFQWWNVCVGILTSICSLHVWQSFKFSQIKQPSPHLGPRGLVYKLTVCNTVHAKMRLISTVPGDQKSAVALSPSIMMRLRTYLYMYCARSQHIERQHNILCIELTGKIACQCTSSLICFREELTADNSFNEEETFNNKSIWYYALFWHILFILWMTITNRHSACQRNIFVRRCHK